MKCLFVCDVLAFSATSAFLATKFKSADCYTAACLETVKYWFVSIFICFYTFQFLVYLSIKTSKLKWKTLSFCIYSGITFVCAPAMLILNLYGNIVIENLDEIPLCHYSALAEGFQMFYLIATYCLIVAYMVFTVSVKDAMKRYFALMETYIASRGQPERSRVTQA